ncbi:MAG TPA: outer membrane beta-barrel protein [Bryobacteraceae bacterium]|nr:outer membrane beta-barrel protein [Bryobacteraceae bacterium]
MRKIIGFIFISVLGSGAACAQALSVGVLGGAPFTDVTNAVSTSTLASLPRSTNFVIGPALQVNLPASFRIEVDALYRPYSFQITSISPVGPTVSANQWQFPFLLQYRFKTPVLKPFVEAGVSFDHLSNISAAAQTIPSGQPGSFVHASHASVVLGAGVDVKIPFVRLSGELRYSHAGSADFAALSKLNQAEVLVGIHF